MIRANCPRGWPKRFQGNRTHHRRGSSIVLVAISLVVVLGFSALTIDVGLMYNARADLQRTADAAALASADVLRNRYYETDSNTAARLAVVHSVEGNLVLGRQVAVDPATDVVFGRAAYDHHLNAYSFFPTATLPNAVRVTIRHTENSPNGPLPLIFARVFGRHTTNVTASAAAAMTGARDVALVIDLSGSMKHDSYLRFHDVTQINARDIWASLDGPPPSRPYIPGAEHETEYAFDTGPTIGIMDTWGDPIDPATYDATTDPGLWYIPRNVAIAEPAIQASLVTRGYSAAEINVVMGSSDHWSSRVAVMLGLAEWSPSGPGDSVVGDDELTWIPYPPYRKDWTWNDFIGWAGEPDSKLTNVHPQFQYRFGVKTFVDFMLDRKDNFSQTDLTATPEEPLTAVKDGVQAMVHMSSDFDQFSLEVFGSTSRHEVNLTEDRQAVADRLYQMQANHYDNSTNMGAGLQEAINELTSVRARDDASKVIVLMSDGCSTVGIDPLTVAQTAADQGILIYTISVGFGADRGQLQQIAAIGGGIEFFAGGTPEEYSENLRRIYLTLGGLGRVALVE